jgi:hypothetical protein
MLRALFNFGGGRAKPNGSIIFGENVAIAKQSG